MLSLTKNKTKKKSKKAAVVEVKPIALFESLEEMWQYNWRKFNQTNDLEWLIKHEEDRETYAGLQSVFERENFIPYDILDARFLVLMDDWYVLTNAHSSRDELYTLMKKAIIARNEYIQGDKFQINMVKKFERMIDDLTKDSTAWNPDREIMALSIHTKFLIDETKITVSKYQALIDIVSDMNRPKTETDGEDV